LTTVPLADRSDYHWPRRIFHMVSGVLLVLLSFQFRSKQDFVVVLLAALAAELIFEGLRLGFPPFGAFSNKVFGRLMRTGENHRLSGVPYYLAGVAICFLLFPRGVAILAVLFLAFGDPIASIAAKYFKNQGNVTPWMVNRSWEGTLSCAAICFFITFGMSFILFAKHDFVTGERWVLALVGAACAAIGESLPLRTDDNLSIPLISGSLLWLYASFTSLVPGLVN